MVESIVQKGENAVYQHFLPSNNDFEIPSFWEL